MKRPLTALCLLGLAAGSVLAAGTVSADGPDVTVGTPNPSGDRFDCSNDQCQYGFQDMAPGSGWTLGLGWQLGIQCGRDIITGVGFWSEFVVVPGPMDVVINGTTAGTFATESPGENYLEIMPPFEACGGACITLCPRGTHGW